jgi:hypothetical protein
MILMAEIEIPDQELADLFSARIMDALSAETKEKMISEALKYLVNPKSGGTTYPSAKSRMQESFEFALIRMSNKLAEEVLQSQGVEDRLRASMVTLLNNMPDVVNDQDLQAKVVKVLMDHLYEKGKEEGRRGY